ncbi:FtsX-like permease family protein [Planctomycetes bacterium Pan216]|uniref:FtsX-like permease family protein n=1 Tax=Kolteria novifilia TaxID=2527975 RepID=A0A518AZM4_9BACT|nr:FtsX-like permease family protein [Planctomycetes bacterium Pan216]
MNHFALSLAYIRERKLPSLIVVLSVSLGVALLLTGISIPDSLTEIQSDHPGEGRPLHPYSLLAKFLIAIGIAVCATAYGTLLSTFDLSIDARRRQFSILRSLGAHPAEVLWLVIGEAALLLAIGELLGLGFGIGTLWCLEKMVREPASAIPHPQLLGWWTWLILLAVGGSGLLIAIVPAHRASKLDAARELS